MNLKMEKMKKKYNFIITLLFATLLFPIGCSEDFLDEEVRTFYSADKFYSSPEGMKLAVVNLYTTYHSMVVGDLSWLELFGTDVAEPGQMQTIEDQLTLSGYTSQWNANLGTFFGRWTGRYSLLNKVNLILSYIDVPEWKSDSQKGEIKGNALFFRALCLFYLVQSFGDVPLITEPVAEAKTDFVRDDKTKVAEQIVADLTEAIAILPGADNVSEKSMIGKGVAQHLLTNVYLYLKNWEKAEQVATDLINGGDYHLMTERFGVNADKPGTVWSDVFVDGNRNRYEGNYETLWVLECGNLYFSATSNYLRISWNSAYDNVPGMKQDLANYQRGKALIRVSEYFLSLFDENDSRGSEYAIKKTWIYNNSEFIQKQKDAGNPLTQLVNGVPVEIEVGDTVVITPENYVYLYPVLLKFMNVMGTNPSEDWSDLDYVHMRLSETYLFRAEARFRLNNLAGAADDINRIRKRANAPEISSSDVNIDLILDERARELTGEEDRRSTLVRTEKLVERNKLYNARAKDNIQEKHNLLPIPQNEIDRMKDSPNFNQNPGF